MSARVTRPEVTATQPEPSASIWAARRRHAGTREAAVVLAVLLVATAVVYHEVVFLGRTLVPLHAGGVMGARGPYGFAGPFRPDPYHVDIGASAWQFVPWVRKVSAEYAAGRLPLWNEHQGFGAPLLGNAISGALDPLLLPVWISGSSLAWDAYYLLRTVLGAVAAYLFARVVGLVPPAGLFLALAYVFSGHFMFLGNNTWIEAYFLLPAILLGTELLLVGRTRLGFAVTAVSVAWNFLVGMPQVTLCVLPFAAGWGGWRVLARAREGGERRLWARRAALLAGAWVVGVALAAPLLLPLFEYVVESSSRAGERVMHGLTSIPLSLLVLWFTPDLGGHAFGSTMPNGSSHYVGITVLVLAVYGLRPSRGPLYRHVVPFTALATLLLLAKIFGVPGINELGRLPGLNVTRIYTFAGPVAGFGLALLAAFGVHRLVSERPRSFESGPALGALIVLGWLAIGGLSVRWSAGILPGWLGATFFAAAGSWAIVLLRRWLAAPLAGLACCGLVLLELFVYAPRGVYQDRYDWFVEPPYVGFLRDRQADGPFRAYAVDLLLFPNSATAYGIDDARALDALYPDRYRLYVQNLINPSVNDRWVGGPYASSERFTPLLGNRWLDLAGVRYVLGLPNTPTLGALRGGLLGPVAEQAELKGKLIGGDGPLDVACAPPPLPCHVDLRRLAIDGSDRLTLYAHPPVTVALRTPVAITPERPVLRFSPVLDPQVWAPDRGDGVGFEVAVEVDGVRETVYRRAVDPKNDPSQRHWLDERVDLSRFAGRSVALTLTTDPLATSLYDLAMWGDLRLTPTDGEDRVAQYAKVYGAEIEIWENHNVLPRAFLVGQVAPVADIGAALDLMKRGAIDPARVAVVEGAPPEEVAALSPAGGEVAIRDRTATYTALDVDAGGPSLLVLTATHYPGWIVTVDGRAVPIYPADVAFRGVFVPAGRHVVEFAYRPLSFMLGLAIALAALAVVAVVAAGPWLLRARRKRAVGAVLPRMPARPPGQAAASLPER